MGVYFTPFVNGPASAVDAPTLNSRFQEIDNALVGITNGSISLTAPAVASFANAQHDHENAAGGGKLLAIAIDSTGHDSGQVLTADGAGGSSFQPVNISAFPPGSIVPYAGAAAPAGWLLCAGQAVSRTTFSSLFAIIGTTYGAGDGSTTFNVPDMRGRVPLALDNLGGSPAGRVAAAAADILGGSGGSENQALTTAQLPAHSHQIKSNVGSNLFVFGGALTRDKMDSSSSGGMTNTLHNTESTGSGQSHNNMQPYIALSYIIKT